MRYEKGDIVVTEPGRCKVKVYLICGAGRNGGLLAKELGNSFRTFNLPPGEVGRVLARTKPDDPLLTGDPEDAAATPENEAEARKILAGLKPGGFIHLKIRKKVELWRFGLMLPAGRKRTFTAANIRGTTYAIDLGAVVVPQPKVEKWMMIAFGVSPEVANDALAGV